jgi:hypothetical protein
MKLLYLIDFITRENGRLINEEASHPFITFIISSILVFPMLVLIQHHLLPADWSSFINHQIDQRSGHRDIVGTFYFFTPSILFIPYFYYARLSKRGKALQREFVASLQPIFERRPVLVRDVSTYVLIASMVCILVLNIIFPIAALLFSAAVLLGFSIALRRINSA